MNRYKVTKNLGDGSFGVVMRAQNKTSGEWVAIKKMKQKFYTWEECTKLREVASLRKLIHPNIVKLKEVIRENDELFMIFEFMEGNLYEVLKGLVRPFPEGKVRNVMLQTMQAVAHVHKHGYFHRDLKPENILVTNDVVKLADFGLAREIRARPPFTEYVSTRWYRAPEVLLRSSTYNSPLDVWACGGILAELYTTRPLFPGSSETDQLHKICSVLGTPTAVVWPDGFARATQMGIRWQQFVPTRLESLIPQSGPEGIALMYSMLQWDPNKRSSAAKILQHQFFEVTGKDEFTMSHLPQLPHGTGGFGGRAAMRPSVAPTLTAPQVAGINSINLPQLQSDAAAGGEIAPGGTTSSSKGRRSPYLRMARYQPGVQQTPMLPAVKGASSSTLTSGQWGGASRSNSFNTASASESMPGSSRIDLQPANTRRGFHGFQAL
mmetsp:Transcript_2992/g.6621  ORF Transcript_2992/g.6621 Transcript_2992/m.6621 type:complete len:436 (+) Transcript_2992:175-1482(+)